MRSLLIVGLAAALAAAGCGDDSALSPLSQGGGGAGGAGGGQGGEGGTPVVAPPWVEGPEILVDGEDTVSESCRTELCQHNENVDMTVWNGSTWLVHRTAESQILGDNSSLRVYQSTDDGLTFDRTAILPAVTGRDIRDPSFYQVGSTLYMKAIARVPSLQPHDAGTDSITMGTSTTDGIHWTDFSPIGPEMWSFWRVKEQAGVYYSAAYEDGDLAVKLFSSTDGVNWTAGPLIYDVSADTPLETELTFMPSGKLLALVRMDGTDDELLGDAGRLRTKICWADPPYSTFSCPSEFDGQRLDGPLSFFHDDRLFVIARRHLHDGTIRKRTSLFEITGDFDDGGALGIEVWGDLPSAGDTSYAGYAPVDADHIVTAWYSSDIAQDPDWILGMISASNIWKADIDFSKLQ
jgi:hypothetical protein